MKTNLSRTILGTVLACLLALLALPFTVLAAAAAHSNEPDIARIDAYVSAQMQTNHIPGVALGLVHNDQIVHVRGFGSADQSGRAVTPQTPFLLASVSKSFTALAVMQLVEAGKIELDAPVQRYLPWFRVADPVASARISVRHLLYHTSGLPDSACSTDQVTMALEPFVRGRWAVATSIAVRTTMCWDSSCKRSRGSPTPPTCSSTSLLRSRCTTVSPLSKRPGGTGGHKATGGSSGCPSPLITTKRLPCLQAS